MVVSRSVGNGRQARQNSSDRSLNLGEVHEFLFCFVFLTSTPGLYRKRSVRLGVISSGQEPPKTASI